jgi:hypothetical protein
VFDGNGDDGHYLPIYSESVWSRDTTPMLPEMGGMAWKLKRK